MAEYSYLRHIITPESWCNPCGTLEWSGGVEGDSELLAKAQYLLGLNYSVRILERAEIQQFEPERVPPEDVSVAAYYANEIYLTVSGRPPGALRDVRAGIWVPTGRHASTQYQKWQLFSLGTLTNRTVHLQSP
jgi:hypothetical protein